MENKWMTLFGILFGSTITMLVLYVGPMTNFVRRNEISDLPTKTEILMLQSTMQSNANAINRMATEVRDLREQVGELKGEIKRINGNKN